MDIQKIARLKQYFKNSKDFFWGILSGNQTDIYNMLKVKGLGEYSGKYEKVKKEILTVYQNDFEKVIKAVIKIVKDDNKIDEKSLAYLRNIWKNGDVSKVNYEKLKENNIKHLLRNPNASEESSLFFERNSYSTEKNDLTDKNATNDNLKYVVRWSEFGKIWFQELDDITENDESFNLPKEINQQPFVNVEISSVVTQKLLEVLEALPYNAKDNKNQQMREKILILLSLAKVPELKPIFDQLTKVVDIGQMMCKVVE